MTASITSSAKAPESESSQTGVHEPSMEDILASIRRIIAEDQSNSLGRSGLSGLTRRTTPTPSLATPEPVLEPIVSLAEDEDHPTELSIDELAPSAAETEHLVEAQVDMLSSSYTVPEEAPAASLDAHPRADDPREDEQRQEEAYHPHLDTGIHETAYALSPPDHVAGSDDGEPLLSSTTGASITSSFQALAESVMLQDPGMIERITRETLRPMLKTWLDDHLPSIVERLVRSEIERVARGGRSRD